jgi:hypothetical protein
LSISQINKLFQNKGCNIAVSTVLGFAVILGLGVGFGRGCASDPQAQQGGAGQTPIVEAGGYTVTQSQFDQAVAAQEQQFGGANFPESFSIVQIGGSVLRQQVNDGLALKLAKDEGIDVSAEKGKQVILQQALEAQKMQFIGNGELRPDATQQEFENVFKAKNGVSFADARKELEKRIDDVAKEPNGEDLIGASVARILWIEQNKSKYVPADDKVKAANQTLFLKELNVTPEVAGKTKPEDKAKQILSEIKGGMSFEAAMDKYLPKPTEKGKKASDQTREVLVKTIENDPSLKALLTLKPGETSGVLTNFGTPAIYKLIKKGLPDDFAKREPALKDQMAKADAQAALDEKIKALDTPENVKWRDEAYHVLYDSVPLAKGMAAAAGYRQKML